jgi:hypothetical protein
VVLVVEDAVVAVVQELAVVDVVKRSQVII